MIDIEEEKRREAHFERMMYLAWLKELGETNEKDIQHLKNCVSVAIREGLTPKQREYLSFYLFGHNITEIADMFDVEKSTVSRTVHRAVDNLTSRIKYATPRTLHVGDKVTKHFTRLYTGTGA